MEVIHYSSLDAVSLGIKDGFTLGSLTICLMFWVFMRVAASSRQRLFTAGISFVLTVMAVRLLIVFGVLDYLLVSPFAKSILFSLNLLAGMLFIILGILDFLDWFQIRFADEKARARFMLPGCFFENNGLTHHSGKFFLILTAVILACMATLMSDFWPQNYYLFTVFMSVLNPFTKAKGIFTLVLYAVGSVTPLCILWAFLSKSAGSNAWRGWFQKGMPIIKIGSSAVFLSVGFGLYYAVMVFA